MISRDCEIRDCEWGIGNLPLGATSGTWHAVWSSSADPRFELCHGEVGICRYKDSDVRPSASITPSDVYSGCIAMCPLRPLFFTNAVGGGSRIPKIFTSSLEGQETNEKRPSIDVHARDTKKFIKVVHKIYKRDLTDRKMWSEEIVRLTEREKVKEMRELKRKRYTQEQLS